jgi:hypothetical protein
MIKLTTIAALAALATSSAVFAAGPGADGNAAFSNEASPNGCGEGCVSNGVVQFGANGGIANTNGQGGLHANENSVLSNPGADEFDQNVKPGTNNPD